MADLRDQRDGGMAAELAWCGTAWGGNVGQAVRQPAWGALAVVDGGAFVTGERNGDEHPLPVPLTDTGVITATAGYRQFPHSASPKADR